MILICFLKEPDNYLLCELLIKSFVCLNYNSTKNMKHRPNLQYAKIAVIKDSKE